MENLVKQFRELIKQAGGPTNSRSGSVDIFYDPEAEKIIVYMDSSDIPTYSEKHLLGPFNSDEEVKAAFSKELVAMQRMIINKDRIQ